MLFIYSLPKILSSISQQCTSSRLFGSPSSIFFLLFSPTLYRISVPQHSRAINKRRQERKVKAAHLCCLWITDKIFEMMNDADKTNRSAARWKDVKVAQYFFSYGVTNKASLIRTNSSMTCFLPGLYSSSFHYGYIIEKKLTQNSFNIRHNRW